MRNRAKRTQLVGKITISRCMNGREDTPFRISIEDELSGCNVIEVLMSAEVFANTIGGLGFQSCLFEYNSSDVIGKKRELKTEIVNMPKGLHHGDLDVARKAVKPFEIDGWQVHSLDDCFNSHKWVAGSTNKYRVSFIRWVAAERAKGTP